MKERVRVTQNSNEQIKYYKRPIFFSFSGVIVVFLGLFFLFSIYINFPLLIIMVAITLLLKIFLSSHKMFYFGISDQHLVVKNSYFFWRKKFFLFEEIDSVFFTGKKVGPAHYCYALGIVLSKEDGKEQVYLGATLGRKQWKDLFDILKSRGIKMRNNVFFTKGSCY
jgi:hypothetical protein